MSFWPLILVKRLPLNRKLTPAEMDLNFTDIEGAVNAVHSAISVALNPDGTLKNNSVSTAAIQDRAVTLAKLAFLSNFYAVDTGGVNALSITFAPLPLSAYGAGLVFYVKAANTSTGPTTLNVDSNGARVVKKWGSGGISDLTQGDIESGGVYEFVDDGTQFVLLNPTFQAASTGPVFITPVPVYPNGPAIVFTDFDASGSVPAGAKAVILQTEARWNNAMDGEARVEIRTDAGGDAYLACRAAGSDAVATGGQGQFKMTPGRHFEYRLTETIPGSADASIALIGYVL